LKKTSSKKKKKGHTRSEGEINTFLERMHWQDMGWIKDLKPNPPFFLYGIEGWAIAKYTPDSSYTIVKPKFLLGLPAGTKVVEEYKGSKSMRAYKRPDYSIFRRWIQKDYGVILIENIAGVLSFPKCMYPKTPRLILAR